MRELMNKVDIARFNAIENKEYDSDDEYVCYKVSDKENRIKGNFEKNATFQSMNLHSSQNFKDFQTSPFSHKKGSVRAFEEKDVYSKTHMPFESVSKYGISSDIPLKTTGAKRFDAHAQNKARNYKKLVEKSLERDQAQVQDKPKISPYKLKKPRKPLYQSSVSGGASREKDPRTSALRKEQEELKHCTFRPAINPGGPSRGRTPEELLRLGEARAARLSSLRVQQQQQKTASPGQSQKPQKSKRSLPEGHIPLADRAGAIEKKRAEFIARQREEYNREMFTPKINGKSKWILGRRGQTAREEGEDPPESRSPEPRRRVTFDSQPRDKDAYSQSRSQSKRPRSSLKNKLRSLEPRPQVHTGPSLQSAKRLHTETSRHRKSEASRKKAQMEEIKAQADKKIKEQKRLREKSNEENIKERFRKRAREVVKEPRQRLSSREDLEEEYFDEDGFVSNSPERYSRKSPSKTGTSFGNRKSQTSKVGIPLKSKTNSQTNHPKRGIRDKSAHNVSSISPLHQKDLNKKLLKKKVEELIYHDYCTSPLKSVERLDRTGHPLGEFSSNSKGCLKTRHSERK